MRSLLALLATAAMAGLGALSMTWWLVGPLGDGAHPSDDELIEHLRRHREDFDALRVAADGATPVGGATYLYGGSARSELDDPRRALLKRMRALDVDVNLVFTEDEAAREGQGAQLQLAMHSRGIVTSGSIKGLLWSPERPPGPVLASLDGDMGELAGRGCPEHETCLRPIEGGWYVFVNYDR